MKTVRIIPYYAVSDPGHRAEVNRLARQFAAAVRRAGFRTFEAHDGWVRNVLAIFSPCCLMVTVGFSRSGASGNPQTCAVVPDSPNMTELRLARSFAATLAGTLNRGLRQGKFGTGVLQNQDYASLPVLCDFDTNQVAAILGYHDSFNDRSAVYRADNRLWDLLAAQIKTAFTPAV